MSQIQNDWTLIDSDPGVFTELISKFGVKDVVMEEILDTNNVNNNAYGLIFLFKYKPRHPETVSVKNLFFANQVINNACATLAILHVLMNTVQVSGPLLNLKEFTADFDSETKGIAVGNCDEIRLAHNSFTVPQNISFDQDKKSKGEDSFHFTAFIPFNGNVYELDGLLDNPVLIGPIRDGNWIDIAVEHLHLRLAALDDIRFNLMAIVPDPLVKLTIESDAEKIELELAKREQWRKENIRRRFNYWPLIFKILEEKSKLP
eukprot:NODE_1062_length_1607_cov_0.380637.p1 type:complete len:261 gc:universal NODE_1062_length_1607_cov_0.380637:203-985(+)